MAELSRCSDCYAVVKLCDLDSHLRSCAGQPATSSAKLPGNSNVIIVPRTAKKSKVNFGPEVDDSLTNLSCSNSHNGHDNFYWTTANKVGIPVEKPSIQLAHNINLTPTMWKRIPEHRTHLWEKKGQLNDGNSAKIFQDQKLSPKIAPTDKNKIVSLQCYGTVLPGQRSYGSPTCVTKSCQANSTDLLSLQTNVIEGSNLRFSLGDKKSVNNERFATKQKRTKVLTCGKLNKSKNTMVKKKLQLLNLMLNNTNQADNKKCLPQKIFAENHGSIKDQQQISEICKQESGLNVEPDQLMSVTETRADKPSSTPGTLQNGSEVNDLTYLVQESGTKSRSSLEKLENKATESVDTEQNSINNNDSKETTVGIELPRRKRGRPRKNPQIPVPPVETMSDIEKSVGQLVARNNRQLKRHAVLDEGESSNSLADVSRDALPVKKRRGRPPKKKDDCVEDSDERIECGVCGKSEMKPLEFKNHILLVHNGLARPKGESQEFEEKEAFSRMAMAFKKFKKIKCLLCRKQFTSKLGAEYHYKMCGVPESERYQTCPICKADISLSLYHKHRADHNKVKHPPKLAVTIEPSVGRPKRNVVRKSMTEDAASDKELNDEDSDFVIRSDSEDEQTIESKKQPVKSPSKLMRKWNLQLSQSNFCVCPNTDCNQQFLNITLAQEHLECCAVRRPPKIYCPRNGSQNYIELTRVFRKENYMQYKFCEFEPRLDYWKELSPNLFAGYRPKLEESSPFRCVPSAQKSEKQWETIKLFDYFEDKCGAIVFAGGPILCASWCPMPDNVNGYQYLALSVDLDPDKRENPSKKGMIQIWRQDQKECKLALTFVFDYGQVNALEWCPSGAYEEAGGNGLKRLGLLAAACQDGTSRLFSIPHPRQIGELGKCYYKLADITLCKENHTPFSFSCTKLLWFQGKCHKYLLAGHSNGYVLKYNMLLRGKTFSHTDTSGITFYPMEQLLAHPGERITSLNFLDAKDHNYIFTGGSNRFIKIWDLTSPANPVHEFRKAIALDTYWSIHWPGCFIAFDEMGGVNRNATTYKPYNIYSKLGFPVMHSTSAVWSVSGSQWFNAVAQIEETGLACGSFLQDLNCENEGEKNFNRFQKPIVDIHTEYLDSESLFQKQVELAEKTEKITWEKLSEMTNDSYENVAKNCRVTIRNYSRDSRRKSSFFSSESDGDFRKRMKQHYISHSKCICWNNNVAQPSTLFVGSNTGLGKFVRLPVKGVPEVDESVTDWPSSNSHSGCDDFDLKTTKKVGTPVKQPSLRLPDKDIRNRLHLPNMVLDNTNLSDNRKCLRQNNISDVKNQQKIAELCKQEPDINKEQAHQMDGGETNAENVLSSLEPLYAESNIYDVKCLAQECNTKSDSRSSADNSGRYNLCMDGLEKTITESAVAVPNSINKSDCKKAPANPQRTRRKNHRPRKIHQLSVSPVKTTSNLVVSVEQLVKRNGKPSKHHSAEDVESSNSLTRLLAEGVPVKKIVRDASNKTVPKSQKVQDASTITACGVCGNRDMKLLGLNNDMVCSKCKPSISLSLCDGHRARHNRVRHPIKLPSTTKPSIGRSKRNVMPKYMTEDAASDKDLNDEDSDFSRGSNSEDEQNIELLKEPTQSPSKLIYKWNEQLGQGKLCFCPNTDCEQRFLEIEVAQEHFNSCLFGKPLKFHNSRNVSQNYIELTRVFRKENYMQHKFCEFEPSLGGWKELSPKLFAEYRPKLEESPPFRCVPSAEKSDKQWETIKLFDYFEEKCGAIVFAGGPILCASWCPMPDNVNGYQYLALSVDLDPDKKEKPSKKGMIQIWRQYQKESKLALTFVFDYGQVNALEWCPSGAYEEAGGNGLKRLGLLAAACQDGTSRLFSIPHPHQIGELGKCYHKLADITLSKEDHTPFSFSCTKLIWFQGKFHNYIVVGNSNGNVLKYNLFIRGTKFSCTDANGITIYPMQQVLAHREKRITGLNFLDAKDHNYIFTGGSDRFIKVWDLTSQANPVHELRKAIPLDTYWSIHWPGCFIAFDDMGGMNRNATTYKPYNIYTKFAFPVMHSTSAVWSICGSQWLNAVAQIEETGLACASFLRDLNFETEGERNLTRFQKPIVNIHTEYLDSESLFQKQIQLAEKTDKITWENLSEVTTDSYETIAKNCRVTIQNYPLDCKKNSGKTPLFSSESDEDFRQRMKQHYISHSKCISWNNNVAQPYTLFVGSNSGLGKFIRLSVKESLF